MQGLAALAELGITVYRRRPLGALARPPGPAAMPATPPTVAPVPGVRAPSPVAQTTGAPALASAEGRLRIALGPGAQWPRLRAHLLKAWQASPAEASAAEANAADVVFGGRGKLLSLPSLGALAGNPALKRQAWQGLRALRRSGQLKSV